MQRRGSQLFGILFLSHSSRSTLSMGIQVVLMHDMDFKQILFIFST